MYSSIVWLTQGKFAIIDEEDRDLIRGYNWRLATTKTNMYAQACSKATKLKTTAMHRIIMDAPIGLFVDHINHNGLDNRKANLRLCTRAENTRYQRRYNTKSGYKGVSWWTAKNRWIASLALNNKNIYLGTFDNPRDAAFCYDAGALKYHGEFAMTNKMLGLL